MSHDWHELSDLTGDRRFVVTRVRLDSGVSVEGEFELPPLARLRYEDQVFVSAFVRSHGSIKEMEKAFGVSYPTVKNRLNRITEQLGLVEAIPPTEVPSARAGRGARAARERRDLRRRSRAEAAAVSVPPLVLDLRVAQEGRRPFRLWLPLFLLWPLALLVAGVALVVAALMDAAAAATGGRSRHATALVLGGAPRAHRGARRGSRRRQQDDHRPPDGLLRERCSR